MRGTFFYDLQEIEAKSKNCADTSLNCYWFHGLCFKPFAHHLPAIKPTSKSERGFTVRTVE